MNRRDFIYAASVGAASAAMPAAVIAQEQSPDQAARGNEVENDHS
jgi:hypothetical protein